MTNLTDKFLLLMWKHWVTAKRQWIFRVAELCVTLLLCIALAFMKGKMTYNEGVATFPYDPAHTSCTIYHHIFMYAPENNFLGSIVKGSCKFDDKVVGWKSSKELNKLIDKNTEFRENISGAILFNDELKDMDQQSDLIPNLEITFRFRLGLELFMDLNDFYRPGLTEGFETMEVLISMQGSVTDKLVHTGGSSSDLKILLRRFPFSKYPTTKMFDPTYYNPWLYVILPCFMFRIMAQVKDMVIEKECQLKESMKIMGLPAWLYLLTWVLSSLLIYLIHVIIMTIFLLVPITSPVFYYSSGGVLFLFLFLAACCAVSFSYLLSTFFSKSTKAMIVTVMIFFGLIIPYYSTSGHWYTMPLILLASLCFTSTLAYGFYMFGTYEYIGEGIHWYNVWSTPARTEVYSLGPILIMLLVDTILYFVIALYIETVFPGEFGVPQRWYFPFTKSYWTGKPSKKEVITDEGTSSTNKANIEEVSTNLPIGIQIKNLTKIYGGRPVVKNFSLDLYEGHITVLLGHNGAGKTTTMHMITGMIPPSGGTILVNNYDVRTNLVKARDSMGLCMQHNVLFDELTVWDHLYFVCKLRNMPRESIDQEIKKYVRILGLQGKEKSRSKHLSGGMQRKLCIGMAMCGKPKVVMLDEPTSSLDPSARRGIWNLLLEQKHDRTILLITHFMDEADLLGDRIAIMSNGELECCGSSFFLKKKYGSEYHLILEVTPNCEPNQVTNALRGYISSVRLHARTSTELTYMVPESESQKFESMLSFLENRMNSLGVVSYGVSPVSLEEVFLRAGFEAKKYEHTGENEGMGVYKKKISYVRGCSLLGTQFVAMALKRSLSLLRSWLFFLITQFILPITIGLLLMLNPLTMQLFHKPTTVRQSALVLSLDSYPGSITLLEANKNNPYAESYQKVLQGHQIEKVDSVLDSIFDTTKKYNSRFRKNYIVGATFKEDFAIAWYNGGYIYGAPLALALVYNAYVKKKFGEEYSIKYIEHPLKDSGSGGFNFSFKFTLPEAWSLGILAFVGFYIFFYVRERICKAKHLQLACGVNTFIFWIVPLIFDLLLYHLTVYCLVIITVLCEVHEFESSDDLMKLLAILSAFGYFVLPFIYLMSFCFKQPTKGYMLILFLGLITGTIFGFAAIIVGMMAPTILFYVEAVFLISPFFALAKGVAHIVYANNVIAIGECERGPPVPGCDRSKLCCRFWEGDFFDLVPDRQGPGFITSFALGILCFFLVVVIDNGWLGLDRAFRRRPNKVHPLEQDVEMEDDKIMNTPRGNLKELYILIFRNLTKYYSSTKKPAVNGVCLGVKPEECFGLIGENGAGKTTIFKMITNDISISYGEIFIAGLSVESGGRSAVRLLGYCPQYDALLEELTPRETLRIFALIRGVPWNKCKDLIENLAKEFDFFQYLDRKVRELSGGNKRKLSISLALIGEPKILCLDEPTTGIDPSSKRFVWNALTRIRESGIPIILSSHDMDECEALCTRACIIVKGNMKCIGSIQRLKSKFAQGYNLTIKIKKGGDRDAIDNFVKYNFPNTVLKETYEDMVTYHIPDSRIPYSKIFGTIERYKDRMGMEDYSLGQCTLEQVFLSFMENEQGTAK